MEHDFDHEQFEHHVVYDEKQMRVYMYLKSMQRQTVSIPKSGIRTVFEKDEMIYTQKIRSNTRQTRLN